MDIETDGRLDRSDWNEPVPGRLPRPTYWPACMAAGWVFVAYGALFSLYFAALGAALVAAGLAGWIGELRHEHD